jgi:hypothetical protein
MDDGHDAKCCDGQADGCVISVSKNKLSEKLALLTNQLTN